MLDGKIAAGSIFYTDRARAYTGFVQDNVHLNLIHCRVNRSKADEEGFTWTLFMDRGDGPEFCAEDRDHAVYSVSTQLADGHIGKLKNWLIAKGGAQREHIRGYVKERQWRANWRRKKDLFIHFVQCWAETEEDLRSGLVSMDDVERCVAWDYSSYIKRDDVDEYDSGGEDVQKRPTWVCPGCDKVIGGRHCAQYKFAHKQKCPAYKKHAYRRYDHETSRCLCCV